MEPISFHSIVKRSEAVLGGSLVAFAVVRTKGREPTRKLQGILCGSECMALLPHLFVENSTLNGVGGSGGLNYKRLFGGLFIPERLRCSPYLRGVMHPHELEREPPLWATPCAECGAPSWFSPTCSQECRRLYALERLAEVRAVLNGEQTLPV